MRLHFWIQVGILVGHSRCTRRSADESKEHDEDGICDDEIENPVRVRGGVMSAQSSPTLFALGLGEKTLAR